MKITIKNGTERSEVICCPNPLELHDDNLIYCGNCYSQWDNLEFEDPYLKYREDHNQRQKQFEKMIMIKNLPWWLKYTLLDFFPNIDRQFRQDDDRVNFINLEQLCHSLLKAIGEKEYLDRFKKLKTPSRIKAVDKFVLRCFNKTDKPIKLTRLCDLPMLCPEPKETPQYILDKIPKDNHIFKG